MAYILENEKEYDQKEPKLQVVESKDNEGKDIKEEEKSRQTEENKMKYDSQLKEYNKELKEYTRNKECLSAVLLKKTSQLMRTKLEKDTGFKEYKLYDPVKLFSKIKETCLTYRGNKNEYAITLNVIAVELLSDVLGHGIIYGLRA